MREIKFRVWNKINQNWGEIERFIGESYGNLNEDENLILQQYTGLKDKNNKEIYEGDIVRWEYDSVPNKINCEIKYLCDRLHNGYYLIYRNDPNQINGYSYIKELWNDDILTKNIEIIGNIFANLSFIKK